MTFEPCGGLRYGCGGVILALLLLTAGCATESPADPREYLDERTAATITVVPTSIVLAYERPDLGVNARDYVTLTGVDVNTSGRHATYLVGYAWSTLDKRGLEEGTSTYELVVEDRVLTLTPMPAGFRSLGLAIPPLAPPARAAMALAAPVSPESLPFFLEANVTRLVRVRAGVIERFALWETRRDAN